MLNELEDEYSYYDLDTPEKIEQTLIRSERFPVRPERHIPSERYEARVKAIELRDMILKRNILAERQRLYDKGLLNAKD